MDMTLQAQSRRDKAFKVALLFLLSFSDYISEQLKVSFRYLLALLFFISLVLQEEDNLHSWQCNVSITCKRQHDMKVPWSEMFRSPSKLNHVF